ncbi:nucleotidyltransferase domain-containing protein [Paenibacillus sp. RC84]|uniref:nucleotidyltransferase domain-containing protein n=1 Tax=Paenibacillus sp. RC84 TaxID=3156252 RepID=UPI003517C07B
MEAVIREKLKEIEENEQVKVLFAIESGSRAWGFPSRDSDYDVRFVYVRRPEWYLSIDDKRDVIEVPINEMLDINGWDIRKALKLFRKSNPPLMEWLISDIVYQEAYGFKEEMLRLRSEVFSPKASLHHYLSMAKGNFREYLQRDQVRIKKYFYVLRPILACKWIEENDTNPPILFQELVDRLLPESGLRDQINELLRRKIAGEELDLEARVEEIHAFIGKEIEHLTKVAAASKAELEDPTALLDDVYRHYLTLVWK